MAYVLNHWQNWALCAAILIAAIVVARIVHYVVFFLLDRIARNPKRTIIASLSRHERTAAKWIFPLLTVLIVLPLLPIPESVQHSAAHALGLALIASLGWVLVSVTGVIADIAYARYRIDVADNLSARRIRTQVQVLRRIAIVIVVILTVGIMLLSIPQVRSIGASLLASAGLAGLVVGMAMKPTLANLVAGIEIALTQPIRIEDAVIVEGEWGWIEEINMTYVVVRIWDLRRLVLPISYFLEHPFQNWTKKTANLLGSVYLYVDYTVPVDEVRKELERLVRTTDKWLGTVCVLQVSDAKESTIELRALADAKDAGTAWDLRCYLRENLIKFLQQRYPQSLPRMRAEIQAAAGTTVTPAQPS